MEAQAEKAQAEADKTKGIDTKEAETRIESITQGINNQKAKERLTKIQGNIGEIEEMLQTESYDDIMTQIRFTTRKAEQEFNILKNNREISDKTLQEKINTVKEELVGLGLANELKKVNKDLTIQQTNKIVEEVAQGWKRLGIEGQKAVAALMQSKAVERNANTNVRQFLEEVRENDYFFYYLICLLYC